MSRCRRNVVLGLSFIALSSFQLAGQEDSGWRISPEDINIQVGEDRPLQLLDDLAQELHGAKWSVDDPALAEIQEEDGRVVVHAKAAGTVRVSAALGGEIRFREIKIWSPDRPAPPGTTNWGTHPIGREIGDIPAVPTADGPHLFSLEQTASGSTYLRAIGDDGIQVWTWLMPEITHDVELVCGDWLGGALISANHGNSYTLYTVGKDGKLRWQHTSDGIRKGHAYNLEHLVHVLSQSREGMVTRVTGIDEVTGAQKFDLTLPASHEALINVQKAGGKILCASKASSSPARTIASRLFVSIDGFAYVAFTQQERALGTAKCTPGSAIEPRDVTFQRDERVVLWQIHPDGTYRSTIVEESKSSRPLSEHVSVASPTGAIIPDGLDGVLLSIRWSHDAIVEDAHASPDEVVYRLDQNGAVVYKFPLPKYAGPLHDEMVLGENDRGFATRGGLLIAFNVRDGKEIWRWNSNTPEIEVFAALANGGCLVQTPTGLVEVENGTESKEIFKGKAMVDWQGQMYLKHN
jgi:outer membrane protein assembly factor BamB